MKALAANLNLIVRRFSTKDEVEADFEKIKGICQLSDTWSIQICKS
jgi:hypothetical protein